MQSTGHGFRGTKCFSCTGTTQAESDREISEDVGAAVTTAKNPSTHSWHMQSGSAITLPMCFVHYQLFWICEISSHSESCNYMLVWVFTHCGFQGRTWQGERPYSTVGDQYANKEHIPGFTRHSCGAVVGHANGIWGRHKSPTSELESQPKIGKWALHLAHIDSEKRRLFVEDRYRHWTKMCLV